jgi:phosphoglycolate phosphatase
MAERPFDLVVFDWDGTLADSTTVIAESLQRACRDIGCTIPADVDARYVIGLGLSDALRHAAPDLDVERYPDLSARYRDHYLAREPHIPLFEGARELLEALRESGHRLAVATGKTRKGLDRALACHRLEHLFDATRCADESRSKPDPEMLLHLLDRLDVRANRALMVGDTTHDLQMAERAGVAAVGMTHGAHDKQRLAQTAALQTFSSLEHLRRWLLAHLPVSAPSYGPVSGTE